ncbi:MAG: O-methyltransferase [Anaerolineae bacterium]|nr:MAG: O-methyltransferase [Anaerolineae bacterium]
MKDPFDYHVIQEYLTSLIPPRLAVLLEMEAYAEQHDFPIIGPVVGQLCYQLARMLGARNIFELGSGFGYSTAWFAQAVHDNGGGLIHHTVWDDELSRMAQAYLTRLGYSELVQFHKAEAVQTLRETPGTFDIIFNDIDKEAYPDSLPLIKEKLRPGGLLIIDNMLWHARIFNPADTAPSTEGVRRFTQAITTDSDWVVSLLPLRDGVIIAYKK